MDAQRRETLITRLTSVGFFVVALAVFKPLGLDALGGMTYVHLLVIWVLGVGVCYLTEAVLRYALGLPAATDRGIDYIIRRNLWFQVLNTPAEALMVCLYRHVLLGGRDAANRLSWGGFFETLLIFAFCSFVIGLYWRFKYRNRFLAAELEETRLLNDELARSQVSGFSGLQDGGSSVARVTGSASAGLSQADPAPDGPITLRGTTAESVTLQVSDLFYAEAVGNYVKICWLQEGSARTDMIRCTLGQVERIVSREGNLQLVVRHCAQPLPVSRSHAAGVKARIKR